MILKQIAEEVESIQIYTRKKVAQEAAFLLYTLQEKEYKQAKTKAAKILRTRNLPSNSEIAESLDIIAEETEGPLRSKELVQMRKEALKIMKKLADFEPKLIGSVWRGTSNHNSDIDIQIFTSDSSSILETLKNLKLTSENFSLDIRGEKVNIFHIYVYLSSGRIVDINVLEPEEINQKRICEIYGDVIRGLGIMKLQKVLEEDCLRRFVPK